MSFLIAPKTSHRAIVGEMPLVNLPNWIARIISLGRPERGSASSAKRELRPARPGRLTMSRRQPHRDHGVVPMSER